VKFGTEGLYIMPLISCGFCENRYSGSHVLMKGLNEIFPLFSSLFVRFGYNSLRKVSIKLCWVIAIWWK